MQAAEVTCCTRRRHGAIRWKYLELPLLHGIDDPRCRLPRLIKYNTSVAKELINHCMQLPSNEGFKNAKYILKKVYGNPHKFIVPGRREIKQWPQIKFGDAKGFRNFHNFLLKCRNVLACQRWNVLDTPDMLCRYPSYLEE